MKRLFILFPLVLFLFFAAAETFAYLHPSLRIRALGDEFTGIIDDSYTDVYRNPAYLSFVKQIKVFGQYNNYKEPEYISVFPTSYDFPTIIGHTEYRLGKMNNSQNESQTSSSQQTDFNSYFHNRNTALGGVVLPVFNYGSIALVAELKPDKKTTHDSYDKTYIYSQNNRRSIYSSKSSTKETISNFKSIYGIKISRQLRIGIDYTYLKNNNFYELDYQSQDIDSDPETEEIEYENLTKKDEYTDNSPDLHRGSIGLILKPDRSTQLDLNIHYGSISYQDTSHKNNDLISYYYSYTPSKINSSLTRNKKSFRHKVKSWGANINVKYRPSYRTKLTFLLGGRFLKYDISGYINNSDYNLSEINSVVQKSIITGYLETSENKDKVYSLKVGSGLEHDFSRAIKFGLALVGYLDKVKVRREEKEMSFEHRSKNDIIVYSDTTEWEDKIDVTNDNFRITLPVCVEAKLHKMIKGRLGGLLVYQDTKSLDRSSTKELKSYYSLGLGFSYKRKIYMDVFAQEDITEIKSWIVNIGYNF
ncbi:MAG: hypothetical protein AMJ90_03160 [candidate division Zixibacteria bacterium SM23_73_2]|nr:MAG: hypothetical protein AMJ90_03160 [candidate division Zixibacteria bacterium SM23_73_2]